MSDNPTLDVLPKQLRLRRDSTLSTNQLVGKLATALSLDSWTQYDAGGKKDDVGGKKKLKKVIEIRRVRVNPNTTGTTRVHPEDYFDPGRDTSLNFIPLHPDKEMNQTNNPDSKPDVGVGARYLEIFIDLVSMKTTRHLSHSRYVLDPRFHSMLSEEDKQFKRHLFRSLNAFPEKAKDSTAYEALWTALESLGFDGSYKNIEQKVENTSSHRSKSEDSSLTEKIASIVDNLLPSLPPPKEASPKPVDPSQPYPTPILGHVFIANNSVCEMYCDAFLAPVDIAAAFGQDRVNMETFPQGIIHHQWRRLNMNLFDELAPPFCQAGKIEKDGTAGLVAFYNKWPFEEFRNEPLKAQPLIVLGEVGFSPELSADDHIKCLSATVAEFIKRTIEKLRAKKMKPLARRKKFLLAVPVLGTGYGGAGDQTGNILQMLLDTCTHAVKLHDDLDMGIVCADAPTFALAQKLRRKMIREDKTLWPSFDVFSHGRQAQAEELAQLAAKGQLCLFIGAGVSVAAGGLTWLGLLWEIEKKFDTPPIYERLKKDDEAELKIAEELNLLCETSDDKRGDKLSLKRRIARLTDRPLPSLLGCLLAGLGTKGVITQNYDCQIETAIYNVNIASQENKVSVIPYRPKKGSNYWVLKMHGCVCAPDDIVITKKDYKKYEDSKMKALQGLVQSSLMTSHMLFIGFSQKDPNYLRCLEEVRSALGSEETRKRGENSVLSKRSHSSHSSLSTDSIFNSDDSDMD